MKTQSIQALNSQPDHISTLTAGIMSGCSYSHAFFSAYLYTRQRVQTLMPANPLADQIPTAATDGRFIWLNETFMEGLTPSERLGVLCHEISHDQFDHPHQTKAFRERGTIPAPSDGRLLPFDAKTCNIAQDAIINKMLLESGITLPTSRIEFRWVSDDMSWLHVYERLIDGGSADGSADGSGDGHGGFDLHIEPGAGQGEADQEARKHALAEAIAAGEKAGKVPMAMRRWLDKLRDSYIPWTKVLADILVRVNGQDSLDWHRMNRRHFMLINSVVPRRKSEHCPPIVFVVDTSGSTSRFVKQFLSEVGCVAHDLSPKAIHVLWTTTRVEHVDTLEEADAIDVAKLTIRGSGGTDLRKAFEYVACDPEGVIDSQPAAMVVLTDSETPWPDTAPDYPVIVATTNPDYEHPAWMEIVHVRDKP